jgi:Secretion system C-terminal sorting domain/SprB repeat
VANCSSTNSSFEILFFLSTGPLILDLPIDGGSNLYDLDPTSDWGFNGTADQDGIELSNGYIPNYSLGWQTKTVLFTCPLSMNGASIFGIENLQGRFIIDNLRIFEATFIEPQIDIPNDIFLCDNLYLNNMEQFVTLNSSLSIVSIDGPGIINQGNGVFDFDISLLSSNQIEQGIEITLHTTTTLGCIYDISEQIEPCCNFEPNIAVGHSCPNGTVTNFLFIEGEPSSQTFYPGWTDLNGNTIYSQTLGISLPGLYSATIFNGENPRCTSTQQIQVLQSDIISGYATIPPLVQLLSNTCSGSGSCNGGLLVIPQGEAPFQVLSNPSINNFNTLCEGYYNIWTVDANGCQSDEVIEYVSNANCCANISLSAIATNASCPNVANGNINLTIIGGNGNIQIEWIGPTPSTVEDPQNILPGNYIVVVTYDFQCSVSMNVIVGVNNPTCCPTITLTTTSTAAFCSNIANGTAIASATGGIAPYTYQWIGPSNSNAQNPSNLLPGAYTLNAIDANGCQGSLSVTINTVALDFASDVVISTLQEWNNMLSIGGAEIVFGGNLDLYQPTGLYTYDANNRTFIFTEGHSLNIKPGAILKLDNCTLTSCTTWDGVRVWSHTNLTEAPFDDVRGTIILAGIAPNNSIIEHAKIGIETGGLLGHQSTFWGSGRIQAIGAQFINCLQGFKVTRGADKLSEFRQCNFEINSNFGISFPNDQFQRHMYYSRTFGYPIKGCTFTNSNNLVGLWNDRGTAVHASNSPVKITTYIAPSQITSPPVQCSFNGFNRAIHAQVTSANYNGLIITDAIFHQNKEAIYCNNTCFHYINRNEIHVGETTGLAALDNAEVVYTGIYQYRGSQFEIMENDIYGYITAHPWVDDIAKPYSVGICASRTKTADDEIYKNYLHHLNFGNLANGDNNEDISNNGLRYVCNENDGNHYDFAVTDNFLQAYAADVAELQTDYGTDLEEFDVEYPAGNKFPNVVPDVLNIMEGQNFWNMGLNWNMHYKWLGNNGEFPSDIIHLDLIEAEEVNQCASETHKLVLEDGSIEQVALSNWTSRMNIARTNWQSTLFLWKSLIDGGSTEELQDEIDFAWTQNTWEMRDLLLSRSPYLSAEILTDIADNTTVFPHAVALEIFMANPDVLNDAKFMLHLEEKINPMPEYMIDLLWAAADQVTFRTVLEDELRLHRSIYMEAAGKVMRTHLSDTTNTTTQWITDLKTLRTTNAEFQLIEYYLDEGNVTEAGDRWRDMPTNCTMSLYELRDWELFEDYLNLRTNMIMDNKEWNALSSVQLVALEYIAYENYYGYAGNLAQQVLNEYYDGDFDIEPAVSLGDPNLRREVVNLKEEISILNVYPNPASDYCIVQLSLASIDNDYSMNITDANGKLIWQQKILDAKQQIAIDMQALAGGSYHVSVLHGEQVLQTTQLNVVK